MAITVGKGAPENALDLVARKAAQLFGSDLGIQAASPPGLTEAIVDANDNETEATEGHRAFTCSLQNAAKDVLRAAEPLGWRYVVFRNDRAVLESTLDLQPDGQLVPVSIAKREALAAELSDLDWLAKQPEVKGELEISYLRLPGGLGRAWWLRRPTDDRDQDLLLPLQPSHPLLRAENRVIWHGNDFRATVAKLAAKRLEEGLALLAKASASRLAASPCRRARPDEPKLEIDDIPGNILLGFNKPFETLLFFDIVDAVAFRNWLLGLHLTSTRDVIQLREDLRAQGQQDAKPTVRTTWVQVAFSHRGLERLVGPTEVAKLDDPAFREGLRARTSQLGDPAGLPWKMGDGDGEPDVLLVIACDEQNDLAVEVESQVKSAEASGARHVHREDGRRLAGGNREHFGFRDGVSQPGIRGRLSDDPRDFLTLRKNADNADEGMPGQTLVWPGEFIFGYPGQDPIAKQAEGGILKASGEVVGETDWTRNGSYLVYRRLRQLVQEFRRFLKNEAQARGLSEDRLAALLFGRFRSGTPISRTPVDNAAMAADEANNDFRFARSSPAISPTVHPCQVSRVSPPAPADKFGEDCPFSAHIRKTYPRDDEHRFGPGVGPVDTETHRILRRGIPFGPELAEEASLEPDGVERGLLFLCYQTSIIDQFEHIHITWANEPEAMITPALTNAGLNTFSAGVDPIIGQTKEDNGQTKKKRQFVVHLPTPAGSRPVALEGGPWVEPTGGGYFFVPSLSTIGKIGRGEPLHS